MSASLEIFMPFWGRFDHFRAAVESLRAQTDPEWRLTIVDDRYPDEEPGRWVQALGDDRIRYLRNEENLGVSRNYVKCVGLATAEFMVIFGCDDVMRPGYIARVKELLAQHPDAAVVQPGVRVIDGEGREYLPLADRIKSMYRFRGAGVQVRRGEELAASLLRANWTYFPSLVWRTELLREYGFDQDLDVVQDLIMLLDIVDGGGALVLDDEPVFEYRRHASSVSSATAVDGTRFAQERALFDQEAARFDARGWARAARAARRHTSSRLNAISQVPRAFVRGDTRGLRILLAHARGRDVSGLVARSRGRAT